jgi:hypothetical protein
LEVYIYFGELGLVVAVFVDKDGDVFAVFNSLLLSHLKLCEHVIDSIFKKHQRLLVEPLVLLSLELINEWLGEKVSQEHKEVHSKGDAQEDGSHQDEDEQEGKSLDRG